MEIHGPGFHGNSVSEDQHFIFQAVMGIKNKKRQEVYYVL
jgi:hypothetical protein